MSVGVDEESEESHGLRFGVEGVDEEDEEEVDSWRLFSLAMFCASACSICS